MKIHVNDRIQTLIEEDSGLPPNGEKWTCPRGSETTLLRIRDLPNINGFARKSTKLFNRAK